LALVLAGASVTAADERYEDAVGDVPGGVGADIVAVTISQPWESLLSFELEFATDPPLTYDPETTSTDELWLGLSSRPEAASRDTVHEAMRAFDEFDYIVILHGATLREEIGTGSAMYDKTGPAGDEVYWRVIDVAVDGPVVTLTFDRKLVGDPEAMAFFVVASSGGPAEADVYDVYPDEDQLPARYPRQP
jgi:hypothetical protein